MSHFNIVRESTPAKSFRVESVLGTFDLSSEKVTERFEGDIDLPSKWNIGLIVGRSGSGKTTIAKELFGDYIVQNFNYSHDNILDDMPEGVTMRDITKALNSVGFSSPPSWLKPYSALSNGEKMRCDIARAILESKEMFVFDEFTSVVDRNVARISSFAIQKAIRRNNKKFIAISCHYDIQDWLMPDWVFNTDTMTFQLIDAETQKKNRPAINLEIREITGGGQK
jgi:ABC-type ATPase with predicted acetyltransferase domain